MIRDFLDKSVCKDCTHMVRRLIRIRSMDILLDDLGVTIHGEYTLDDEENAIYESCICKELGMEIDHDVLECSIYAHKNILKNSIL
jgi:hypothetical protein